MILYKKMLILFLSIILFAGCSINKMKLTPKEQSKVSAKNNLKPSTSNIDKDITGKKISFDIVHDDNLPQNITNSIKSLKSNRGYILYDYEGYYYISIFSGKENTGGYSIKVLSVENNEGELDIVVQETAPKEGNLVTQVITYPYVTIKVRSVSSNVEVKNTKGEVFSRILHEGDIY